ncbi:Undecaprenyl-diphosphatase [Candidatus Anstonella stagnisolia]|nr:Undecaprenyl-diphosphatase [Candidatus Anstonella stagnisolia]
MDLFSILTLGLVQGITEWVPISSKTQDAFVYLNFFHGDPSLVVPILLYLHIGTVLAATIYFRKEILELIKAVLQKPTALKEHSNSTTGFLFTSLLFTGVIGVPLLLLEKLFFPTLDGSMLLALMGAGLLLTGFLLLGQKNAKARPASSVTWADGILTGVLQGLSVLPGVSRSGTSTTGLIWRGFDSESSFHLSFLLSIPTVVFAELVFYIGGGLAAFPISEGFLLALSSFFFGYLTLGTLLKIVRRVNLSYVAFVLGALMLVAAFLHAG